MNEVKASGSMAEKIAAAKAAVASSGTASAPAIQPIAKAKEVAETPATPAGDPDPVSMNPNEKVYHHRFHGANFVMPNGKVLTFLGGTKKTDKPDEILELDKVANVPGSYIFTTSAPVIAQDEKNLARDLKSGAEATFDEVNKIPQGAKTVAMPMAPTQVSNLSDDGAVTEIRR